MVSCFVTSMHSLVYSWRCISSSEQTKTKKSCKKSIQFSEQCLKTFSELQACIPRSITGGGLRSADQFKVANQGSMYQSSDMVDIITDRNPIDDISFVKTIEELNKLEIMQLSKKTSITTLYLSF